MDNRQKTAAALKNGAETAKKRNVLVGLDGFVDRIIHPVDKRHGQGDRFDRIRTIELFGNRVLAAAGKSANIELSQRMEKLGGNGPIMAHAVAALGAQMRYVGALGESAVNPVFADFAAEARAVSVADPGETLALEFEDGKLMLGIMQSLENVTYERIIEKAGREGFLELLDSADVVALVNWTMLPNMTDIFKKLLADALPALPQKKRAFFFDLADPAKRSRDALKEVLELIARFGDFGETTLALNFAEAQQIDALFGNPPAQNTRGELEALARRLREKIGVDAVVIHPTDSAACATPDGVFWVAGPYVSSPKITTGAGDHFNAGFVVARQLGLDPEACLTAAVGTSGYYVRTAQSPTLAQLADFLESWK